MTIDPDSHDVAELRRAARRRPVDANVQKLKEHMEAHDESADETGTDVLDAGKLKDLLLMESSATDEQLSRPYLTRIPGKYAAEVTLFEWLDFLLNQAGLRQTLDALEYYVNIGWLGESAAEELRDHVRGFRELAGESEATELDADDHVLSLVYIARLASMA